MATYDLRPGVRAPRADAAPVDPARMRHNPAQQRSIALVERMLEAAAVITDEHGLAAVTTSSVAKRARVSAAAVYRYFPDRLAILYALIARDVEIYASALRQLYDEAPPGSLVELINVAIEARASMYRTKSNVSSLLLIEMVAQTDAALAGSRLVADVLVRVLYETFDMPSNQNQIKRVELGLRVGDILIHRAFKLNAAGDAFILREAEEVLLRYLTSIYAGDDARSR